MRLITFLPRSSLCSFFGCRFTRRSYEVKGGFDENVDAKGWRKMISDYDCCLKEELDDEGKLRELLCSTLQLYLFCKKSGLKMELARWMDEKGGVDAIDDIVDWYEDNAGGEKHMKWKEALERKRGEDKELWVQVRMGGKVFSIRQFKALIQPFPRSSSTGSAAKSLSQDHRQTGTTWGPGERGSSTGGGEMRRGAKRRAINIVGGKRTCAYVTTDAFLTDYSDTFCNTFCWSQVGR